MINTILQTSTPMDYSTIIITIIGTVGAGGLVKLVTLYYQNKKDKKVAAGADGLAFRDSLQDRVVELEDKVGLLQGKIEEMISMYTEKILILSTEKATLIAKLEAVQHENEVLAQELEELKK